MEYTVENTTANHPGDEICPDEAGGYCQAGGLHGQGVLWWKKLCWNSFVMRRKNIARSQNALQNTSHQLSRCQVVLTKRFFVSFEIDYCQNLSFL